MTTTLRLALPLLLLASCNDPTARSSTSSRALAVVPPAAEEAKPPIKPAPWLAGVAELLDPHYPVGKIEEKAGKRWHFATPSVRGVAILDLTKLQALPEATRVTLSTKAAEDYEGARWGTTQRPCWVTAYGKERWYRPDAGPLRGAVLQLQQMDEGVQAFVMTEAYILNDSDMQPAVRDHALKCLGRS